MTSPCRVWLSGGTGFLGSHLLHRLVSVQQPHALSVVYTHCTQAAIDPQRLQPPQSHTNRVTVQPQRFDLLDAALVEESILNFQPHVIVHTAAQSNTGLCEKDPQQAEASNVIATRNVVAAMRKLLESGHACHLVHLSTDWVYPGDRALSRVDPATNAVAEGFGSYGHTKALAEKEVVVALGEGRGGPFTVLRSALMFGAPSPLTGKHSFLKFMLDGLHSPLGVDLFEDEWRSPVPVSFVVDVIVRIVGDTRASNGAAETKGSAAPAAAAAAATVAATAAAATTVAPPSHLSPSPFVGRVFNLGGVGRSSRLDLGKVMCAVLSLPLSRARGTTLAAAGVDKVRPQDLSMDSAPLYDAMGARPGEFREEFARIVGAEGRKGEEGAAPLAAASAASTSAVAASAAVSAASSSVPAASAVASSAAPVFSATRRRTGRVTFLRHAESRFNVDASCADADCALSPAGVHQAQALTGAYSLAITSPFLRARATLDQSQITYASLEVWADAREQRVDACDFLEGEERTLESDEELMVRADGLLAKLQALPETAFPVLVVAHCELLSKIVGRGLRNAEALTIDISLTSAK